VDKMAGERREDNLQGQAPFRHKDRKKKSGHFCLNNKKRYRRDDPTVEVRPNGPG